MSASCLYCNYRYLNCHMSCLDYRRYNDKNIKQRELNMKENSFENYLSDAKYRMKTRKGCMRV